MRMNLWLRTAETVLWRVGAGRAVHPSDARTIIEGVPWRSLLPPGGRVRIQVDGVPERDRRHGVTRGLVREATKRWMRRKAGGAGEPPTIGVVARWSADRLMILINVTGRPLSSRSPSPPEDLHPVPLPSTAAAGILRSIGHRGEVPLVLPMVGDTCFASEAALIAGRRAPGLRRAGLTCLQMPGFDPADWTALRLEARAMIRETAPAPVLASDPRGESLDQARWAARRAGVEPLVRFDVRGLAHAVFPPPPGRLLLTPPPRTPGDSTLRSVSWSRLGSMVRELRGGFESWIVLPDDEPIQAVAESIGLDWTQHLELRFGPTTWRLHRLGTRPAVELLRLRTLDAPAPDATDTGPVHDRAGTAGARDR